MREEKEEEVEEGNWFSRWEEELPSPEELMPLSQTLITPDLAMAFDIPNPNATSPTPTPTAAAAGFHTPSSSHHQQHQHQQADFDSADLNNGSGGGSGGGNGGDELARTLKRPRLVWTPQLHKRFVDAVAHLGIKNAVPKTIMQLMSVDGLTRENVASHLQKYRLYLKRMQGLNSSGGGGGGGGSSCSAADAATDQLFASAPIPHHFLTRGGGGGGGGGGVAGQTEPSFMPFVPVAALQHHQQMVAAAAAAAAQHQHQHQQQYYQQRQMGFDHGFLARGAPQPGFSRMGLHGMVQPVSAATYNVDDLEEGNRGGGGVGRKVLTLFPTGDD